LLAALTAAASAFAGGKGETQAVQTFEVSLSVTEQKQVDTYQAIFQGLVDEFNKAKGTKYQLKVSSGQGMDIINTRMSSRDRPDLFTINSPADVNQFAKDGLLMDLSDASAAYGWKNGIFDWAYSLAQVDGKVVSLPYGYEGMVLWYNKALMAKLGLNPGDIKNLASFEAALKKASDAGIIPIMLGTQDWPWAQEWYLSILYSYTGRGLVKDVIEGKPGAAWNSDPFRKTVALYKSWHDKGYLADKRSYVLTADDAINAFVNGKALFKLEGTWAPYWIVPLDAAAQDNIGVMLHPAVNDAEKPHLPLAVGGMWCVSATSPAKELAGFILNGLLRQDIQDDFLANGMDVAPMKIDEASFKGLAPTVANMWKLVNGALADGSFGYTTWAFYPPQTRVYAYEGIVQVLEGKVGIDAYLAGMDDLTKKELAAGFKPVLPAAKK
jgi:raffinose/stachyose/melibiose transport system substrate-binding protein